MQPLHERYRDVRRRTRQIFDCLRLKRLTCARFPLRHPLRFYEGHLSSFNFGMLLQSGFVRNDPEPELTRLFARGIDPLDTSAADKLTIQRWPERPSVADYIARVDKEMARAFESDVNPLYLHTAVEHEEMHQETLMYLIHRLPYEFKRTPPDLRSQRGTASSPASWIEIEGGSTQLGADPGSIPFGWDNEFPQMQVEVRAISESPRVKLATATFRNSWKRAATKTKSSGLRLVAIDPGGNLSAPPFWSRRERRVAIRRFVRIDAPSARLARLPQPH